MILRKALGLVDWDISKDTHTISTEGGSIELSNGATLTIPPNSTTIPVEIFFAETPTPPHIGEEVIAAYSFATDSELLTSEFMLPVEATDVTSADELMIVYMQRQAGPADPINFSYDPSTHTVTFSLYNNWTFEHLRAPAKSNLIHQNRDTTTPQENNKDNTIVIIHDTPCPSVTGKSGPIQMPFFEQGNAGTCWANSGKMLQKGLYPGNLLGAGVALEVFQFMRLLGIGLNGGIYYDSDYDRFVDLVGRGKTVRWNEYYSFSSAQKKIAEELDRGNPVIFVRLDHVVLVLGYETDIAGDLYLTQHNPQGVGVERGFYESENWKDIATLWNWQDVIAVIWAEDTPDPNRALQSINLPGQDEPDTLYFEGKKNKSDDPNIRLYLAFDHTFEDGYRWSSPPGKENTNHFPQNVNQLFFDMPVYNADLQNSAALTFDIKVYEKDNASNEVVFSKDIVIAPKNKSTVKGDLELTPLRLNLEGESECVLFITLEKGTERTTSIPIDNFFLQPLELEITVSIPGASTNTAGNYEVVADGATYTIKAEVKDKDGNTVSDGTEVKFATTSGNLSTTTATTTNGEAMVTLTSPTTIGSADIAASISKISGTAKIDFIAGPITSLTVTANPATLPADGTSTSTIQIKAVDANRNPVADSSVGITAEHGTLSAASGTTDANGVATLVYTSPSTVPDGGTDTVTATANSITAVALIAITQVPPWDIWPEPQWCPKTGSYHKISNPDEKPDRIYCHYYTDGTLKLEEPKFMFKVSDTYYDRWYGIFKEYYQNGNLKHFITYDTYGTESVKNGKETWYYENGNVFSEFSWKNDILDGAYKQYAEDGTITTSSYYHNGQKDGKETLWDENHIKVSETHYKNGKKDGLQTLYDSSGNIESETYYTQDVKNGPEKLYYSTTGIVLAEYTYSNGKLEGLQKTYNSDGSNSSEIQYTDGVKNGIQKLYGATGILESEVNYTNDKKDGIEKLYNSYSGTIEEKIPWEMGVCDQNGVHELYHPNGQLRLKTPYSAGEVHGVVTEYYDNGDLKRTQAYKSGKLDGMSYWYYLGGIKQKSASYKNDMYDGEVKEYDDKGKMKACSVYVNGQYIENCMP